MSDSFQRARSDVHKEQRRQAILEAAAQLLATTELEDISLSAIARVVGISKSNLYRYFDTREDIFMQLALEAITNWVTALEYDLALPGIKGNVAQVAEVIAHTLHERPQVGQLMSRLASVLENNASEEALFAFKSASLRVTIRAVNALHAALPQLSVEGCQSAVSALLALLAGFWPLANPNETVARVYRHPELQAHHKSFENDFPKWVQAMLIGMAAMET